MTAPARWTKPPNVRNALVDLWAALVLVDAPRDDVTAWLADYGLTPTPDLWRELDRARVAGLPPGLDV